MFDTLIVFKKSQDILHTERMVSKIKGDVEKFKNRKCPSRVKMFTDY